MSLTREMARLRDGADQDGYPRLSATRYATLAGVLAKGPLPSPDTEEGWAIVRRIFGPSFSAGGWPIRAGRALEPALIEEAQEKLRRIDDWRSSSIETSVGTILSDDRIFLPDHTEVTWACASPDGIVRDQGGAVRLCVECKAVGVTIDTDGRISGSGVTWLSGLGPSPDHLRQLEWQCFVTSAPEGMIAASVGGTYFRSWGPMPILPLPETVDAIRSWMAAYYAELFRRRQF